MTSGPPSRATCAAAPAISTSSTPGCKPPSSCATTPCSGTMPSEDRPGSDPVSDLTDRLAATGYVADRSLAMVLYLAQQLQSPILLEGEPGVGKTSVAEALAEVTGARLVRLQCYEGLSAHQALYE